MKILTDIEQQEIFDFHQKYEFADNSQQGFMIQSFNQLGIYHPNGYNELEDNIPEMNREVYPQSKMAKGRLPGVLFIPS